MLSGGVVDAARYSANRVLEMGYSLALVPGGATEALHNHPDHDVVYIRKRYVSPLAVSARDTEGRIKCMLTVRGVGARFGFVKLALEAGASLVPCFSFNECNTYGVLGVSNPTINKARTKFQAIFGISLPLVTNIIPMKTQCVNPFPYLRRLTSCHPPRECD